MGSYKPDVLIFDPDGMELNPFSFLEKIKDKCPELKIIIYSGHTNFTYKNQEALLDTDIYVIKEASLDKIYSMIKVVFDGIYIQHCLQKKETTFSKQEQKVLKHLVMGKSNKEIASALYVSERTVAGCITNIFRKLNVNCRVEAAVKSLLKGYIRSEIRYRCCVKSFSIEVLFCISKFKQLGTGRQIFIVIGGSLLSILFDVTIIALPTSTSLDGFALLLILVECLNIFVGKDAKVLEQTLRERSE